jgi:hypothetical protein
MRTKEFVKRSESLLRSGHVSVGDDSRFYSGVESSIPITNGFAGSTARNASKFDLGRNAGFGWCAAAQRYR